MRKITAGKITAGWCSITKSLPEPGWKAPKRSRSPHWSEIRHLRQRSERDRLACSRRLVDAGDNCNRLAVGLKIDPEGLHPAQRRQEVLVLAAVSLDCQL